MDNIFHGKSHLAQEVRMLLIYWHLPPAKFESLHEYKVTKSLIQNFTEGFVDCFCKSSIGAPAMLPPALLPM